MITAGDYREDAQEFAQLLDGLLEGGAAGFLLKDAPASELARAIRRAAAGERVVDPGLAAAALSEGESPLTEREHEVLTAAHRRGKFLWARGGSESPSWLVPQGSDESAGGLPDS